MKKGFTLAELVVVILIIGILAAMGFPIYRRSIERSRQAEGITALRTLYEAQLRIYASTGGFAPLNDHDSLDIEFL